MCVALWMNTNPNICQNKALFMATVKSNVSLSFNTEAGEC